MRVGTSGLLALLLAGCSAVVDLDPRLKEDPLGCVRDTDCNDDIECTQDLCDEAQASCVHMTDHALCAPDELCLEERGCTPRRLCTADDECQDDDPCNGEERCLDNACTDGAPLVCDDGRFCNGTETCDPDSGCVAGEVPGCGDGVDCTVDSCDADLDACVHSPDDGLCNDGAYCNGAELCSAELGCLPGAPPCDDHVTCTADPCVEASDECLHHADHSLCQDGEVCDLDAGCQALPCAVDGDCDDLDVCNGPETCGDDGMCLGSYVAPCDDGTFCNGVEYCDASGVCNSQAPPTCGDGVECTLDTCDLGLDACVHAPSQAACADGIACNGEELCGAAGCGVGAPLTCDDGNSCTVDACVEQEGGCVATARDEDGDGHGSASCGGDDCDDADEFVRPGADEICNDRDDNCDLVVDEGFDCRRGQVAPCKTSCGSTGSHTCGAACAWGACLAPAEDCNGLDDDCDGQTDEGCGCSANDPTDCVTTCGSTGTRSCVGGAWSACVAPAESCNGADDDCDGAVDDGLACAAGDAETCATGCGSTGTRACTGTCTWGTCAPPAEICNGLDDDCVGGADNGFACVAGSTRSCGAGCGSTGSQTCSATCTWGACTAPAEVCNGADDDCDGQCDEGFACCAGGTVACTTTCGTTGTAYCLANCQPDVCEPPMEICYNGVDDDCNGLTDAEDPECCGPCCMAPFSRRLPCL